MRGETALPMPYLINHRWRLTRWKNYTRVKRFCKGGIMNNSPLFFGHTIKANLARVDVSTLSRVIALVISSSRDAGIDQELTERIINNLAEGFEAGYGGVLPVLTYREPPLPTTDIADAALRP